MAFMIVQHLDPSHPSLAAEIFSRITHLPVQEVTRARDGAGRGAILLKNFLSIPSEHSQKRAIQNEKARAHIRYSSHHPLGYVDQMR
jgi:chemotaxis response regulator CheB